jgi:hypothetical protein
VDMAKVKRGEYYYLGSNQHVKNERVYYAKGGETILQKLEARVVLERRKKLVQMKLLLHLLMQGRPMTDYVSAEKLFADLNVPHMPRKHWSEGAGWQMADAMARVVSDKTRADLAKANYISASADEVTTVDGSTWLSVHVYVCQNFMRVPILLSLQHVTEGSNTDNLTDMISTSLSYHGGMDGEGSVAEKLICFGADGAVVFQGARSGVTSQLIKKHAPYLMGVHCMSHRMNLAVQALSNLPMVTKIENLLQSLHSYFTSSPKKHLEFTKLVEIVETSGLKMLPTVRTRWISMFEPLKRVLSEYKTLIVKMSKDAIEESKAAHNLMLLCDLSMLLALPCLLPLLESVKSLITFSQSRNLFVSDYVVAIKICQAEVYEMYVDNSTSFEGGKFQLLHDILTDRSCQRCLL